LNHTNRGTAIGFRAALLTKVLTAGPPCDSSSFFPLIGGLHLRQARQAGRRHRVSGFGCSPTNLWDPLPGLRGSAGPWPQGSACSSNSVMLSVITRSRIPSHSLFAGPHRARFTQLISRAFKVFLGGKREGDGPVPAGRFRFPCWLAVGHRWLIPELLRDLLTSAGLSHTIFGVALVVAMFQAWAPFADPYPLMRHLVRTPLRRGFFSRKGGTGAGSHACGPRLDVLLWAASWLAISAFPGADYGGPSSLSFSRPGNEGIRAPDSCWTRIPDPNSELLADCDRQSSRQGRKPLGGAKTGNYCRRSRGGQRRFHRHPLPVLFPFVQSRLLAPGFMSATQFKGILRILRGQKTQPPPKGDYIKDKAGPWRRSAIVGRPHPGGFLESANRFAKALQCRGRLIQERAGEGNRRRCAEDLGRLDLSGPKNGSGRQEGGLPFRTALDWNRLGIISKRFLRADFNPLTIVGRRCEGKASPTRGPPAPHSQSFHVQTPPTIFSEGGGRGRAGAAHQSNLLPVGIEVSSSNPSRRGRTSGLFSESGQLGRTG